MCYYRPRTLLWWIWMIRNLFVCLIIKVRNWVIVLAKVPWLFHSTYCCLLCCFQRGPNLCFVSLCTFACCASCCLLCCGMELEKSLDLCDSGHNYAILGQAGTGKTSHVRDLVARMKQQGRSVAVTCSTGTACLQYGRHAQTLHRLLFLLFWYKKCIEHSFKCMVMFWM